MVKNPKTYHKFVVISGTPGTGKTTLGSKLSLLFKKKLVNITEFCKNEGLMTDFDPLCDTYDVDVKKMCSKLLILGQNSPDTIIVDGHMAHFLPKDSVKACIICTTDLKVLKKRLEERKYNKKKVRENLDSEIFEICMLESKKIGHSTITIDTTSNLDTIITKNMHLFEKIFRN